MKSATFLLFALVVIAGEHCHTAHAACGTTKSNKSGTFYVSMTTVLEYVESHTTLIGTFAQDLTPPILDAQIAGQSLRAYYAASGPFGYNGPLGPFGPLGYLGPTQDASVFSPSYWISKFADEDSDFWRVVYPSETATSANPLSIEGPLGNKGPLSDLAYCETLPALNAWSHHLQLGGINTVLGPLGPLGALGPLGPLSRIGTASVVNFVDKNGEYCKVDTDPCPLDARVRKHTVTADADGKTPYRTYSLFRSLREEYAKSAEARLGTSFCADGVLAKRTQVDEYVFHTDEDDEFVTVVLVPINAYDSFYVHVFDDETRVGGASKEDLFVNWVQLKVRGGGHAYRVQVSQGKYAFLGQYKLYVVGSTKYFTSTDIYGAH